jgi:hypothetical protein
LLWLSASGERMGEYRNRPLTNALLVVLILVSIFFTVYTVWGWIR